MPSSASLMPKSETSGSSRSCSVVGLHHAKTRYQQTIPDESLSLTASKLLLKAMCFVNTLEQLFI
jgi:hypothetical protein